VDAFRAAKDFGPEKVFLLLTGTLYG